MPVWILFLAYSFMFRFYNLANSLTILRIVLVPIILFSLIIDTQFMRLISVVLFIFACITDYLDGYVARNFNQISRFGEMLDPIADKLLIALTLVMLVGFGKISKVSMFAVIIIIGREILVSGLREYLAELKIRLTVTTYTKIKTFLQMSAVSLIIFLPKDNVPLYIRVFSEIMLWSAAIITLYSGWIYSKTAVEETFIKNKENT